MDPLTHTLAGATLAETPLGRVGGLRRGLAIGTLLVAANLPDIDVSCYFVGSDYALGQRRGLTHGILAALLLPLLLAGVALLWDRWRSGRTGREPTRAAPLLLIAAVGVWSHPALDWLNVYGIRFLAPFDWTWFYGDGLHIVDPWLWLLLGGAVFLTRSRSPRGLVLWSLLAALTSALVIAFAPPVARIVWLAGLTLLAALRWRRGPRTGERPALIAAAVALLYVTILTASSALGEAMVRRELHARGEGPAGGVMVAPEPTDPLHRRVVAETPEGYRLGRISWLGSPPLVFEERIVPYPRMTPVVRAALRAPSVAGFVTWMRYPFVEVSPEGSGYRVDLIDLRYARRATGDFGTASVRLGADLAPVE